MFQRPQNEPLFGLFHGCADIKLNSLGVFSGGGWRRRDNGRSRRSVVGGDGRRDRYDTGHLVLEECRQMLHFDRAFSGNDHCPLEDVAKLTDVAGPVVLLKCLKNSRREIAHAAAVFAIQIAQKRFCNRFDVVLAFPQRRQVHMKNIQTIIQILAKMPAANGFVGHFVGGGNNPHIHFELGFATEPPNPRIFKNAQ
jgi:hypothetical protein